jgi:hypothetical protein
MLTISLTLVVLVSAILLLYQYATGALMPADDQPAEPRPDVHEDPSPAPAAAARAA